VARLDGELSALQESLSRAEAALATLPAHTKEDSERAERELGSLRSRYSRHLRLAEQRAVYSSEVQVGERQLAELQEVRTRGSRTREVITHFEALRTVFHRNEAARMVSYTYIETMIDEINSTLGLFDAPFRVEMDETLGFTARFLDGVRVQPDKRLSVGERIVLAIAFRVTVNATFANQIGVLVLDEPTAGLDEHNLGCLPRAIERLRDLSHARGLQVLFVTHEPRIGHLFDHYIELSAA
jgi:DNA repair exonuclease SbcCD ATPase subunit